MELPQPPIWLFLFFSLMPTGLVLCLPLAVHRSGRQLKLSPDLVRKRTWGATLLGALWMALTGLAAQSGLLLKFEALPPPLFLVLGGMVLLSVSLVFSPLGTQLVQGCSLAGLIGLQAFRFPLELAMHEAAKIGLMPPQMSFQGRNFDIVTGVLALILGLLLLKGVELPRSILKAWNILGLALLLNVVTVAILSMPLPFRQFHNSPPNVWVCNPPYIWLPAIMVATALIGHLLIFRKLK